MAVVKIPQLGVNKILQNYATRISLPEQKSTSVYDAVRIELRGSYPGMKISRNPYWETDNNRWVGTCRYENTLYDWYVTSDEKNI